MSRNRRRKSASVGKHKQSGGASNASPHHSFSTSSATGESHNGTAVKRLPVYLKKIGTALSRHWLLRSVLSLAIGLGVLFGCGPIEMHSLALMAPIALLFLAHDLRRANWIVITFWSIIVQLSVQLIAFGWLLPGLMRIGRMSFLPAAALFLGAAVLLQLKLPFFILMMRALFRRIQRLRPTAIRAPVAFCLPAVLAVVGDLFFLHNFPWYWGNLTGGDFILRNSAAWGGVYGLSVILFLEATVIFYLIRVMMHVRRRLRLKTAQKSKSRVKTQPGYIRTLIAGLSRHQSRWRWIGVLGSCVIIIIAYGYGLHRILEFDPARNEGEVVVGYFQPSLEPAYDAYRNDRQYVAGAFNLFANLGLKTILTAQGELDVLVAPESAAPFHSSAAPDTDASVAWQDRQRELYSPTMHSILILLARYGRVDIVYNELTVAANHGYHNSITVMDAESAERTASYHKRRLIPFGEYLPGELESDSVLRPFFPEVSRYRPGDHALPLPIQIHRNPNRPARRRPVALPELRPETMTLLSDPAAVRARFPAPGRTSDEIDLERTVYFAPLVCYESLFPEYVRAFFIQRQRPVPALIINTSNDVWFGNFIEVYQHNAGARLRAIEMGRYMVRANQSGLSTIFDPLGRAVVPPLQPGERDVRAAAVPLRTEVTAYMRHGNFSVFLFTGIVILLMVIGLCYPSLRRPPVA